MEYLQKPGSWHCPNGYHAFNHHHHYILSQQGLISNCHHIPVDFAPARGFKFFSKRISVQGPGMGFEDAYRVFNALGGVVDKITGVGGVLFLIGFVIVFTIFMGFVVTLLVRAIKMLPNMTPSQFLKFTLIMAISLMIVGLLIP
jgi:hypothetical protein